MGVLRRSIGFGWTPCVLGDITALVIRVPFLWGKSACVPAFPVGCWEVFIACSEFLGYVRLKGSCDEVLGDLDLNLCSVLNSKFGYKEYCYTI